MNRNDSPWANPALALALLRPRNAATKPQQLPPCDTPSCQQAVNKERETEKGKSPHTPLKEKDKGKEFPPIPTPAPTCARARNADKSASVSDSVGFRQVVESVSVSESDSRRVDADFIRDWRRDPVAAAMIALHIPQTTVWNGNTYYNEKILRRLMRQIGGEDVFRELVYQQWRENNADGAPRSYPAVFFAKLYALRKRLWGGEA